MAESQPCQILLVEPDKSDLAIIRSVLNESGAIVHSAASAEQAMDKFAYESIDIVLTELIIGGPDGIDGLEFMNRVSLVDHSTKVVFLTEEQSLDCELNALAAGAFDYLRKPISHARLLQHVVARAYQHSKLERQNQNLLLQLETAKERIVTVESTLLNVKKKFRRLATTDSLTNLYNRRFVEQMLKQEVDRRNRYKTALSIAFIDVDAFTPLCHEHGHEISNFILKDIARILLQCSRTSDIVGRFAADVFVVLLPETDPQNGLVFAERVRSVIDETRFETSTAKAGQLSVCVGVSGVEVTSGSITYKQLTVAASKALHSAKRNGPNKVCTYPESIEAMSDSAAADSINNIQSTGDTIDGRSTDSGLKDDGVSKAA